MRIQPLFLFSAFIGCSICNATELTIATWNLEHLNDTDKEGCVPRTEQDYEAVREEIRVQGFDVVAIQEVENESAAYRVFPKSDWDVVMSFREFKDNRQECKGMPGQYLRMQATGFAIRRGIGYERHEDFSELAGASSFQRWGVDITISEGIPLRLLSVHLRSGCWGAEQDRSVFKTPVCSDLSDQLDRLTGWINARRQENKAFAILGDFNRRLAVPGDWGWQKISTADITLSLPTKALATRCDPRYKDFIDHFVLSQLAERMMVSNSIKEVLWYGDHPDHCALKARFRLAPH